jgi:hypothetical protein
MQYSKHPVEPAGLYGVMNLFAAIDPTAPVMSTGTSVASSNEL